MASSTAPGWDWAARAGAVRNAHEALRRRRTTGDAFHATWLAAWPPGFFEAQDRLDEGRATGADIDLVVGFLEADPIFFRSGYVQEWALRRLKRALLDRAHAERLRAVVLDAIERRTASNSGASAASPGGSTPPELRSELRARAGSGDPAVRRHAEWVLEALERRG